MMNKMDEKSEGGERGGRREATRARIGDEQDSDEGDSVAERWERQIFKEKQIFDKLEQHNALERASRLNVEDDVSEFFNC